MHLIGAVFGGIDRIFRGARRGVRDGWRFVLDGPGQSLVFALILVFTGVAIVLEAAASWLDRIVGWLERGIIFFASIAMTFLAFNEYMQREFKPLLNTDLGGIWALTGQMNLALLLMVVVGFVGASMATQEDKHLNVNAVDRVLTRGPARFVKRLTALVAFGLCWLLMRASWAVIGEHSHDTFEGVKIWAWMVAPVNWAVSLMPGEKYGPGTEFENQFDWEDAKFDLGLDFDGLPIAYGYVGEGDGFPLWIALMVLVVTFAIMAARYFVRVLVPKMPQGWEPASGATRRATDVILAGLFPGALIALGLALWLGQGWMILISAIVLVFLGTPLWVAVGIGTVACWVLVRHGTPETVVIDMFEATKKQELLAIPFFVLAGNLMTQGSMAERLIGFARALLGRIPGGLGVGAVVACGIFAAISGSSPVTVIAIGSLMFPMLLADGYREDYSMGVLTSAGGLGIIIPPSIPMIVFAIVVGAVPAVGGMDVAELFKAGILPGVFIALMLALYTLYTTWPRPGEVAIAVRPPSEEGYALNLARATARGALSLLLPILVLGGIYGLFSLRFIGIDFSIAFTVTEAAAVAVVYALVVELIVHRELRLRDLPGVFNESAIMMGTLFLIIVLAISLNLFFSFEQIPEKATDWMVARVDTKVGFLIAMNLFLLALGMVMDILSAILIVAPLLAPIAMYYGIHPIHFGIMFIVNLELGYLTPPMGINLFVSSTVFERSIIDVIKAVIPFLLVMLFCLVVIIAVPELSLLFVSE